MNPKKTQEKTKEQLQFRRAFFEDHQFENEISLIDLIKELTNSRKDQNSTSSLATLALQLPQLRDMNCHMRAVQQHTYNSFSDPITQTSPLPLIMEPPSSGESSPCDTDIEEDSSSSQLKDRSNTKISFDELCSLLIDSKLLVVDQLEAQKADHRQDCVRKEWVNVKELMLVGLNRDSQPCASRSDFEHFFQQRFQEFPFIRFTRFRFIYFRGKFAGLIKFEDENSAQFTHYNILTQIQKYKSTLGHDLEVYRVLENKTRNPPKTGWVGIFLRFLPTKLKKEDLQAAIQNNGKTPKITFTFVEELIEIHNYRYALLGVPSLEIAELVIQRIKELAEVKNLPLLKANLHPLSSKSWQDKTKCKFKNFLTEKNPISNDLMVNEQRKLRQKKRQLDQEERNRRLEAENLQRLEEQKRREEEERQRIHQQIQLESDLQQPMQLQQQLLLQQQLQLQQSQILKLDPLIFLQQSQSQQLQLETNDDPSNKNADRQQIQSDSTTGESKNDQVQNNGEIINDTAQVAKSDFCSNIKSQINKNGINEVANNSLLNITTPKKRPTVQSNLMEVEDGEAIQQVDFSDEKSLKEVLHGQYTKQKHFEDTAIMLQINNVKNPPVYLSGLKYDKQDCEMPSSNLVASNKDSPHTKNYERQTSSPKASSGNDSKKQSKNIMKRINIHKRSNSNNSKSKQESNKSHSTSRHNMNNNNNSNEGHNNSGNHQDYKKLSISITVDKNGKKMIERNQNSSNTNISSKDRGNHGKEDHSYIQQQEKGGGGGNRYYNNNQSTEEGELDQNMEENRKSQYYHQKMYNNNYVNQSGSGHNYWKNNGGKNYNNTNNASNSGNNSISKQNNNINNTGFNNSKYNKYNNNISNNGGGKHFEYSNRRDYSGSPSYSNINNNNNNYYNKNNYINNNNNSCINYNKGYNNNRKDMDGRNYNSNFNNSNNSGRKSFASGGNFQRSSSRENNNSSGKQQYQSQNYSGKFNSQINTRSGINFANGQGDRYCGPSNQPNQRRNERDQSMEQQKRRSNHAGIFNNGNSNNNNNNTNQGFSSNVNNNNRKRQSKSRSRSRSRSHSKSKRRF